MHHFHEFLRRSRPQRLLAGCDIRVRLIVALTAIVAIVVSTHIGFGLIALGAPWPAWPPLRTPPKALVRG